MGSAFEVDWAAIDTVLLDMDGTLLDLRFDNWFWQELVPEHYAALHGISQAEAFAELEARFRAARGTLRWYCIEHWTRELSLDIATMKRDAHERIGFLPGATRFLSLLRELGKRSVVVSNAHPQTLAIKRTRVGLDRYVEESLSSHPFGVPKENAQFWPRLQAELPFDPQRTLFIDDSLAVLHAAGQFGIAHLRAVRLPDSGRPPQDTQPFVGIDRVADLLPTRHLPR